MKATALVLPLLLTLTSSGSALAENSTRHCGELQRNQQTDQALQGHPKSPFVGVFDGAWGNGKRRLSGTLVVYAYKEFADHGEAVGFYAIEGDEQQTVQAGCWGFTGRVERGKLIIRFDPVSSTATYTHKNNVLSGQYKVDGMKATTGTFKRLKSRN